ncbi:TonB-dependent Receptor Plug Domain [Spirosomataceae bacterium TFI 002]|nr:TonB-dependent Receptor Plug Domain [Spirosomataceae bacterium TFI 002]
MAQASNFFIKGKVIAITDKEPIEGASIYFSGSNFATISDSLGMFSASLQSKVFKITVRSVDNKLKIVSIDLDQSTEIIIELEKKEKLLDEVVITAEKSDANVKRAIMGVEKMSGKTLKKLPTLMGEADVIRSIMMLPGVSTVGEGAAGFNVRGGNVDQNLVLLDGIPLYNTSHLFGFFTSFNADMVQDISLYKGGIPSRFGGRTSSVLDVRLKSGSFEKWQIQGGLGPISSKILLEGPIFKGKTSIIVGARGSISDFYLKYFDNPALKKSKANFYDLNAKVTQNLGKSQQLSIGVYASHDAFKLGQDTLYYWDTQSVYLKHNALLKNGISHNFTALQSNYKYGIAGLKSGYEYNWRPSIIQKSFKEELNISLKENRFIDFGLEVNFYANDAGTLSPDASASIIQTYEMPIEQSRDFAGYIGVSQKVGKKLNVDAGLRYVVYQLVGPSDRYSYLSDTPRSEETIKDTLSYAKNEVIQTYNGFEPRLSLSMQLDSGFAVKFGYNRMQQFMHLLSNTMAISPADIWKNSNEQLPQQIVDQFSVGFFKNLGGNMYETSVEVYYKKLQNVIDYVDGASLYLNPTVETQLLVGNGKAYGAEFFVKKVRGINLTGWLSYTYARSFRTISATNEQIGANFGIQFPSNFDSPHNFKVVLNDRLNKRITFNANFTYNTGRPITFPNGRYKLYAYNDVFNYLESSGLIPRDGYDVASYDFRGQTIKFVQRSTVTEILDGYSVPSFTLRNAERIPDYIRLDIGFTLDPKPNSKFNSSWNFSIYNVLGRQNTYSIYFRSATGLRNQARTFKLSVLAAAIPSLTYNFKF